MKKLISFILSIAMLACICPLWSVPATAASGNMRLAPIFTENMILQRNEKICIFGSGSGTASITLGNTTKEVTSTSGSWSVYFDPMKASTVPVTFVADFGGGSVVLDNVLIGDVYISSGQSNMELTLANTEQKGSGETNPLLRFYNKTGNWQAFTKENAERWSAISVLFAQELADSLSKDIPIGIISTAVGSSRVDDWTHSDYCYCDKYALKNTAHSDFSKYDQGHHDLYKNYIQPIEKLTVAGVLWYQGESNRGEGEAYRYFDMFKTMVNCWRTRFDDKDMPFYTVQIMLYSNDDTTDLNGKKVDEYNIRIAQARAAAEIKNVTLCSMLSLSDTLLEDGSMNIHPTDKLPIAKALAKAAIAKYYKPLGEYSGSAPEYSGPIFKSIQINGGTAKIFFLHTGGGIKNKFGIGTLHDFEVKNGSGTWVKADAKIEGDQVIVTADGVNRIIGVRMGYKNRPAINLYNGAGYCASPFIWEAENAKLDHGAAQEWQSDSTHHWHGCAIEGCDEIFDKGKHSGKGATCVKKASCDQCGAKFGKTDPTVHDGETKKVGYVEPTQDSEGYSGDIHCLSCNEFLEKGKVLAPVSGETEKDGFPWVALIIIVLVVLAAGGATVSVILIMKKKKAKPITDNDMTETPEE